MKRETPNVTISRIMAENGVTIAPNDFGLRKRIAESKRHIAEEDATFSNITPSGIRYAMVCVPMEGVYNSKHYAKFYLYKRGGRWAAEFCRIVDER